ncbi:iron ABC transporter substrate-binding protein [Nocardioides sp. Root614]|nr:iron ABC transporter substrate-binding protein [Nocardioides sp. Root614]KRA93490.1 iron ABC transporter substrate-binding protein [Nocardioides sp. Root682]
MRTSRPLATLATVSLLTALTACAGAPIEERTSSPTSGYPVEVTTCGFTSTLDARPTRAITMNQGATEVALALGVEDQLAGTGYIDDAVPAEWKEAYDSVPVLSDQYPDHETVISVKPDFVYGSYISAYDDEAAGSQEQLADLGIASMTSLFGCGDGDAKPVGGTTFETVWDEIDLVAKAFGVPERAEAIRTEQQEVLEGLESENAGAGITVFWYDSGDRTPYVGTGEGGPQLILDAVGATNVFADIPHGWTDVAWEKVIAADPDVIVLADASWSTAKEKIAYLRNDPVLSRMRAVEAEAFVTLPFSETTPGVRLADGAVDVAGQLEELKR